MTSVLPAPASFAPFRAPARSAELRGWILGLRELRADGIRLAVRGRGGIPGVRSGDRCVAVETAPGRWLLGLVDAGGPGEDAASAARAVAGFLRRNAARREPVTTAALADTFVRESLGSRLVQATLVDVDAARHSVRVVLAGGPAPVAVGRSGEVVALGDPGPALGLVDDARRVEAGPFRLGPGHLLLLATDGVREAVRDDGAAFGEMRVRATLRDLCADTPRTVVRTLLDRIDAFAPDDATDRTALALRLA